MTPDECTNLVPMITRSHHYISPLIREVKPQKPCLGLPDFKSKRQLIRSGLWSGFRHHKFSSKKLSICQFLNGVERLVIIGHFHEAKSLRLPRVFVANDFN